MKVTVLVGSPHKNGSSSIMADSFEKGLKENGHEINRFDLADLTIAPWTEESADIHDDFDKILESLQESDLFVISKPLSIVSRMLTTMLNMLAKMATVSKLFCLLFHTVTTNQLWMLLRNTTKCFANT